MTYCILCVKQQKLKGTILYFTGKLAINTNICVYIYSIIYKQLLEHLAHNFIEENPLIKLPC